MKQVSELFGSLRIDKSWSFEELKRSETTQLTNGYHRYPARFIPQLVNRLIGRYSKKGDLICDPFAGAGTTLIEGLLLQRRVLGVDINPVAYLISKAKTTCISTSRLDKAVSRIFTQLDLKETSGLNSVTKRIENSPNYGRIKFWFTKDVISDLSMILSIIEEVEDQDIRRFLECGFSHILKKCSRWGMQSIKPYVQKDKQIPEAVPTFKHHICTMVKKNAQFYDALPLAVRENLAQYVEVVLGDCRDVPVEDREVSLIATSPPYVTSYEYADIHQLTIFWLEPSSELSEIRKKCIGTEQRKNVRTRELASESGNLIVDQLRKRSNRQAKSVLAYFAEMQEALAEFDRVLKPHGKAAIVIGNTRLNGVNILNGKVLTETALDLGFKLTKIIKRRLPRTTKFLPTIRDPETGCFASSNEEHKKMAYPNEYIIILSKP